MIIITETSARKLTTFRARTLHGVRTQMTTTWRKPSFDEISFTAA